MDFKTVREVSVKNKTVLVRADLNVPLENGAITSDLRIRASLPTLELLRERGAKRIIVISHLGRPEGKEKSLSLKPVAEALDKMIGRVQFVDDVSGPDVERTVSKMKAGDILVLENLRFYRGEKQGRSDFVGEIVDSTGATIYVQDAFAALHREDASIARPGEHLPVYAGLLVEKEVRELTKVSENPARPMLLIIGGAKVEDKQPLIEKFLPIADKIVVGGKIAADGYKIPKEDKKGKIYVAEDFDEDGEGAKLDVGPVATAQIAGMITDAKTVVWNGLLGKAEDPAYATASTIVAEMMGEKEDGTTVVCGGDTTGFVANLLEEHPNLQYSLVSTGGGAALEFLLGKELPGLKCLE